nr:RNA-dependent RNA polymerase [Wenzhou shrimp virus 10]
MSTLDTYANCIRVWHQINFKGKFSFHLKSQLSHFQRVFSPYPQKQWPKIFKGLLAHKFSVIHEQELPEVIVDSKHLFYPQYHRRIHSYVVTKYDEERLVRVFWDLMQTKALAARVPDSFIKDALVKHSETVGQVTKTDPAVLEKFAKFCEPFMKRTGMLLSQQYAGLPKNHASYEFKRGLGGVGRSYKSSYMNVTQPSQPRLDPITILVSGEPGCGKSLLQNKIASKLAARLDRSLSETVYVRNSSTRHWDGYKQQPLAMIDDFLQTSHKQSTEPLEAEEFITLNSTCDHVLPMADLREKGMRFTSPIILYSSNHSYHQATGKLSRQLHSIGAICRRIKFYIEKRAGKWILFKDVPSDIPGRVRTAFDRVCDCGQETSINGAPSHGRSSVRVLSSNLLHKFAEQVVDILLGEWERRCIFYDNNIAEGYSRVPIGPGVSARFEPVSKPHNRVKVVPLTEPLKVRTITVGTAENFLLKPLQRALLQSLKGYAQFKPCFDPNYQDQIDSLRLREGLWLSGDYTSATDGLHQDLFHAGLSSLESYIPENLWNLVKREMEPHLCEYPSEMGIPDCWQTNGQLMGSLLSFPLLCLANAFTLSHTMGKPVGKLPALFHGDDLLAKVTPWEYEAWKAFCPTIGLSLSVGKNYVSPNWGSIDSQVFYQGRCLGTGKFGALSAGHTQSIPTLIRRGVPKGLIVSIFKKELEKTPRSLDVSHLYGGLGQDGLPQTDLDFQVYHRKIARTFVRRDMRDIGYVYTIDRSYSSSLPAGCVPSEIPEDAESERVSDWKGLEHFSSKTPATIRVTDPITVFSRKPAPVLENLVRHSRADCTVSLDEIDF